MVGVWIQIRDYLRDCEAMVLLQGADNFPQWQVFCDVEPVEVVILVLRPVSASLPDRVETGHGSANDSVEHDYNLTINAKERFLLRS